jgi:hypothetical protein
MPCEYGSLPCAQNENNWALVQHGLPARTLLASSLKANSQHSVSGGLSGAALISPTKQIELQFPKKNICSAGAETWWLGTDAESMGIHQTNLSAQASGVSMQLLEERLRRRFAPSLAPSLVPSLAPSLCADVTTSAAQTAEHQWSSGRIHCCHRCDPGSIPG